MQRELKVKMGEVVLTARGLQDDRSKLLTEVASLYRTQESNLNLGTSLLSP